MELKHNKKIKKAIYTSLAVIFWLAVWQVAAILVGHELLLASPLTTIKTLFSLSMETAFWHTIATSLYRIALGFFIAVAIGVFMAIISAKSSFIKQLFAPLFAVIKTIPVASFIILALVWVSGKNLSILISFLMVLPVIYTNTLDGIESTDKKLLQMAQVFKISAAKKAKAIYLPAAFPYFNSGCKVGLGLCWKSGIAAEVIAISSGTIGEKLYQAKIFLSTAEVFSWTIVIIIISFLFEKLFLLFLSAVKHFIQKGAAKG